MKTYLTQTFINDLNSAFRSSDSGSAVREIDRKIREEYTKSELRSDCWKAICSGWKECQKRFGDIQRKIERNQLRKEILYLETKYYEGQCPIQDRFCVDWEDEHYLKESDPFFYRNRYRKATQKIFDRATEIDGYRSVPPILIGGALGSYIASGFLPGLCTTVAAGFLLRERRTCKELTDRPHLFAGLAMASLVFTGGATALLSGCAAGLLYKGWKIYTDLG